MELGVPNMGPPRANKYLLYLRFRVYCYYRPKNGGSNETKSDWADLGVQGLGAPKLQNPNLTPWTMKVRPKEEIKKVDGRT